MDEVKDAAAVLDEKIGFAREEVRSRKKAKRETVASLDRGIRVAEGELERLLRARKALMSNGSRRPRSGLSGSKSGPGPQAEVMRFLKSARGRARQADIARASAHGSGVVSYALKELAQAGQVRLVGREGRVNVWEIVSSKGKTLKPGE